MTPPLPAGAAPGRGDRPLVVDLDGTVLDSDMMAESFLALVAVRPLAALAALGTLVRGRAALKASLARQVTLDLGALPWNRRFLSWLEAERARGRRIYLASASDRRIVEAIAAHLGLFDGVFASDGTVNLKSRAKAQALCDAFGRGGFDYAGNESADLAVWARAGGVVAVNVRPRLLRRVARRWPDVTIIPARTAGWRDYAAALRPGAWLAGGLAFLPAAAAGRLDPPALSMCLAAALGLGCCSSAMAVLAALIRLGRDRAAPVRHGRPFAGGAIPPPRGLLMVPPLVGAAILAGCELPSPFLALLLLLAVVELASRTMPQPGAAIAVAAGHAVRIAGGAVAAGVTVSPAAGACWAALSLALAVVQGLAGGGPRRPVGSGDAGLPDDDLGIRPGRAHRPETGD